MSTLSVPAVRTLRPGLHLLETEVEDFDVRSVVLVGSERAVVWDTLAHPSQMAPVARLVGDLPVTVVYSHADWDHAWGTCGLGRATVVAHEAALARFASDVPSELDARRRADPDLWRAVELVPPEVTFEERHVVDLGGAALLLHALPGHTPDCIVGVVPEWGVLLAGDTVETPLPVVNDGAAVPGWTKYLERWRDDAGVAQVIPAHGRLGGRELIGETLAYLRALLEGASPDPGEVPPFYEDTHRRNVRVVADAVKPPG
ncbi:MAG: MBL fold metallo-hydrolase [Gemmatimonadetes bacterium]|nr:MBL fold metallo-hydrolase [Gemmatimonadota bacterium]